MWSTSAYSKLYGEQQQCKRRNGKKLSLETLSKLCTGQIFVSKKMMLNSIILLTLQPGAWLNFQRANKGEAKTLRPLSLSPRIQLCSSPKFRWGYDCGVHQNAPFFVTAPLYPLRTSVGCSWATLMHWHSRGVQNKWVLLIIERFPQQKMDFPDG